MNLSPGDFQVIVDSVGQRFDLGKLISVGNLHARLKAALASGKVLTLSTPRQPMKRVVTTKRRILLRRELEARRPPVPGQKPKQGRRR